MDVYIWSRYHPPMVLWSLCNEILWRHSVESSSYFRFLFCLARFLWSFAYVLMTSVTYGMLKSLCKVTFDMYQGVLASFLNVLDWNVWRIFVLQGLLHAHNSILLVQTGLFMALYMVVLFSRDSCDFVFISQFIFLTLSSTCLLLAFNHNISL
jgi:hypothetical protein